MKEIWDQRYDTDEYVYGIKSNSFFAEQLNKLSPGSIILPCEGEGRNAVFAASTGWKVIAFDQSTSGKTKALKLADENKVAIDYRICDALDFSVAENSIDVVAFIYAHFPETTRKKVHENAMKWLKPGGKIIIEAFNKNQLKNSSGGPKDISLLYSEEMLREDFSLLKIELLQSFEIELQEGNLHKGNADVIRFVGKK
ncbi:MAG: class I SAM-dependent methyltransferase [Bacteroidota bacterium]|nr:class I SAM-dependent methyltransferase [Bacteroidota bacterium]